MRTSTIAAGFVALLQAASAADVLDLLWPSPLLKLQDPVALDNNKALRRVIKRLTHTQTGVTKTNYGGWQSDVDLFEREEKAIVLLRTRAYHAVFRYLQVCHRAMSQTHARTASHMHC